ncbi:LOW QUALITY PROTEIN: hypothetical protein OSB04_un001553 [Centaurea solstitialis]|uniref:Uncharacterized protein n=1 Tax=Centaurea solstitialis TaxID=347529 RepID=A0AA38SAK5_9ASTR|nr:LOW QUALITY PROTEIN: hypothetical protein OSB04_un001553 [Centaurea solstitialis]
MRFIFAGVRSQNIASTAPHVNPTSLLIILIQSRRGSKSNYKNSHWDNQAPNDALPRNVKVTLTAELDKFLRQRVEKSNGSFLELLGPGPSFLFALLGMKINGKIGFSCQTVPIGNRIDYGMSSHCTWFHKYTTIFRIKFSRFLMKKIWPSVFYSIRVGEEPTRVKQKPSQDDPVQTPFFVARRSYHFEGTGRSYVVPRSFETRKNGVNFFVLGTTYRIRHYQEKDNGNALHYTSSFMEIHRKDLPRGKDDLIRIVMRVPIIAFARRAHVVYLKEVGPPCFSHGTILFPAEPTFPSVHRDKNVGLAPTVLPRKKGLTKPGSR